MQKPDSLCLAPWVHTYLSPQTERRMCCASREPAQNFRQYIDTESGTGTYIPITLEQHWNGEHMRSVRRRMLAGELLPECEICNDQLLNTDVYRTYFWHLFQHKYLAVLEHTDADGYTTLQPVSWDYRFSNLCNFKCRMCGDMLSSSWESEQKTHSMVNWSDSKNNWMRPEVRQQISQFQDSQIEQEFSDAVEQHRVEEVYWVGGEPLMYEQHWRYMQRIIELGDGPRVYARYNTNLSRVEYRGINLYRDILPGLRAIRRHSRQVRIDFTLTLPGMFEVGKITELAQRFDVDILAKVIFSFSPDIVMSPLALPRHLLEPWLDELIQTTSGAMQAVLTQLKNRPTFEEQWPDTYKQSIAQGRARMLQLEQIRTQPVTMTDILSERPEVLKWWMEID